MMHIDQFGHLVVHSVPTRPEGIGRGLRFLYGWDDAGDIHLFKGALLLDRAEMPLVVCVAKGKIRTALATE